MKNTLKIALGQISPVWLNKDETLKKVEDYINKAAKVGCELIVFGEGLVPGYPYWLALTGGAEWDTRLNKELHSHYVQNSVMIEAGDLNAICKLAKKHTIAIYLGTIERAKNRGGHSIYASLVYINEKGKIKSVHRKLGFSRIILLKKEVAQPLSLVIIFSL